jgi:hypothetical protein
VVLALLVVTTASFAARGTSIAGDGASQPPGLNEAAFHCLANGGDAFLAARYRRDLVPRLAVFGIGGGRPWEEVVLDRLRPHFYLQRSERLRLFLGFGAEGWLRVSPAFRLALGAGVAYTAADFTGTRAAPDEGWTPLLLAGGTWSFPTRPGFVVSVNYLHADLRSEFRNWLQVGGGIEW